MILRVSSNFYYNVHSKSYLIDTSFNKSSLFSSLSKLLQAVYTRSIFYKVSKRKGFYVLRDFDVIFLHDKFPSHLECDFDLVSTVEGFLRERAIS